MIRVIVIFLCFFQSQAGEYAGRYAGKLINEKAFWLRPDIYQKLEEKHIVVSATKPDDWRFKGAGIVKAPYEFSFQFAQQYERLLKLKKHFKSVVFDAKTERLKLVMRFLGDDRTLVLHLQKSHGDGFKRLHWRNEEGFFQGFEGVVEFKQILGKSTQETLIGLNAEYGSKIPMPDWIVTLGSEAVMKHIAFEMREMLEQEYRGLK